MKCLCVLSYPRFLLSVSLIPGTVFVFRGYFSCICLYTFFCVLCLSLSGLVVSDWLERLV